MLSARVDEVALATGRREQLLVLHPMLANAVDAPRAEALADMMSALMLRTVGQRCFIILDGS